MDIIIDLIFDNLVYIIIIGGAIVKLFTKNKEGSPEKKNKAPKPVKEIDWKEIFRQEAAPVEENPERSAEAVPQYEPAMESIEVQQILLDHEQSLQRSAIEQMQERPISDSPVYVNQTKKNVSKKSYFHQLTKDEVVRGVIWSEILGPPRAKKPLEKIYRK